MAELADRPAGYRPPGAPGYTSLVQLRQIMGEIVATGPASKKVAAEVSRLVGVLGPELGILCDVPLADVERAGGSVLAEALARLRRGAVTREAGYDGEYGTVRLFQPGELDAGRTVRSACPAPPGAPPRPAAAARAPDGPAGTRPTPTTADRAHRGRARRGRPRGRTRAAGSPQRARPRTGSRADGPDHRRNAPWRPGPRAASGGLAPARC